MTFSEQKAQTVADLRAFQESVDLLIKSVEEGDLRAFEEFWIEGGTEEGDPKIRKLWEMLVLRYARREDVRLSDDPDETVDFRQPVSETGGENR